MTLSKEIIEILEYIGGKFGIAIDWSSENVIPYVTQLCEKFISWEIATSTTWIVCGVILLIIGLLIWKFCDWYEFEQVIGAVCICCAIVIIMIQTYDIITCNTFPELKILEFLKMKMKAM